MPAVPFLLPGYGAQGGSAADCAAAFDGKGEGGVVNSSRGVLLAWKKGPLAEKYGESKWERAVEEAAKEMQDALRAVLPAGK
jgi:orotidine-5'-phosphate decarboxylase